MASASGGSTSRGGTSRSRANTSRSNTKSGAGASKRRKPVKKNKRKSVDVAVKNEVMLIVIFAVSIFVFLCVIGLIKGAAATGISNVMFGIFGFLAYLIPIFVFLGFAFGISNRGNTVAIVKMVSSVILVFLVGILSYMIMKQNSLITGDGSLIKELYETSYENRGGGGVLFGCIAYGMYKLMGFGGTLFVVIVMAIISIVFITEKSFLSGVKKGGSYIYETAREDAVRMREYREREQNREREQKREREQNREREQKPKNARRTDKKARGVALSSSITFKNDKAISMEKKDIHEITLLNDEEDMDNSDFTDTVEDISIKPSEYIPYNEVIYEETLPAENFEESKFEEIDNMGEEYMQPQSLVGDSVGISVQKSFMDELENMPEPVTEDSIEPEAYKFTEEDSIEPETYKLTKEDRQEIKQEEEKIEEHIASMEEQVPKKYVFPPLSLLKKGEGKKGDSANQLKETALRLQQTLQTFGVKVTITDISQGPSVTRYEMQPEQGVKVSKIVGLADDIKLNLAATDIRIEAPIPGKAAVGIEVPNKENSAVALRDLLESGEFQNFQSNLAFAVGKDIGGQVVVTDIAKMPHVLIAGATGSGKSVCINTIIMSILYKANPDDVKLIMIDPKVVELSVYNGIPHLMIPVVTDPKKASAALNWGVSEMNDRYRKFAEINVRDLKGYNKAAEAGRLDADGQPLQKLPQIVIIVDELADLMMVASGEVEESICRLAQLARACGIHLVIATQRPSVDVITGLIKANMPSRIAFSVSSGVDSRTILDMNGAEKLLGKGDMLFYPQGYPKPARIQGAFVSDSEVSDVVDFLKNQMLGNNTYDSDIENKIKNMQSSSGSTGSSNGGNDVDAYFVDAGKFVIDKDKASIGMLQRVFKIGFNRAARIVDQLEEAGVVGAEEGTKPRRILMSMEQFENYVEENL